VLSERIRISTEDAALLNAKIAKQARELIAVRRAFAEYQENSRLANRVVAAVVRWRSCTSNSSGDEYQMKRLSVLSAADQFINGASIEYMQNVLKEVKP
jgi:hypothetical protein